MQSLHLMYVLKLLNKPACIRQSLCKAYYPPPIIFSNFPLPWYLPIRTMSLKSELLVQVNQNPIEVHKLSLMSL